MKIHLELFCKLVRYTEIELTLCLSLPQCVDLSCNELTEVTLPETLPPKLQELDLTGNPRRNLDHKSLELLKYEPQRSCSSDYLKEIYLTCENNFFFSLQQHQMFQGGSVTFSSMCEWAPWCPGCLEPWLHRGLWSQKQVSPPTLSCFFPWNQFVYPSKSIRTYLSKWVKWSFSRWGRFVGYHLGLFELNINNILMLRFLCPQAVCGCSGPRQLLWDPWSSVWRFWRRQERWGALPAAVHHGRRAGRGASPGPEAGRLYDQHFPHHAKVNTQLYMIPSTTQRKRSQLFVTVNMYTHTPPPTQLSVCLFFSFRKLGTAGQRMGGSAALCHIRHDPVALGEHGGCFTLKAANVGRCQAVLCRDGKAMQLSTTHAVKEEAEYQRVRQHNAIITEVRQTHVFLVFH